MSRANARDINISLSSVQPSVANGRRVRVERNSTEDSVSLIGKTRRVKECSHGLISIAVSECQRPQTRKCDWLTSRRHQGALEIGQGGTLGRENADRSIAKVADQHGALQRPEAGRRHRVSPRCVERSGGGKPADEVAAEIEYIHIPEAGASG